ncbi:MAG: hypothetical protein WCJ45_06350 [bacterium]
MEQEQLIQLQEGNVSQKLIDVLTGSKIQGSFSPGELLFLSNRLAPERQSELLPYLDTLPYWGISFLLCSEAEWTKDEGIQLFSALKKKATTFDQKVDMLEWRDDFDIPDFDQEFIATLGLASTIKEYLTFLEIAETKEETQMIIQKMRPLNLSIDDWAEMEENANSYEQRLCALDEMIAIAEVHHSVHDWLKVYKHCLSGSTNEKKTLKSIEEISLSFLEWFYIYSDHEDDEDYRIRALALRYMQKSQGDFEYWFTLLQDHFCSVDDEDDIVKEPVTTYLNMMYEVGGTMDQFNRLFECLYIYPKFQLSVMQKMMAIADNESV